VKCLNAKLLAAAALIPAALLFVTPTLAQSEPAVNLGATSFLDGAPPGPGVYYFQYLQYYTAQKIKDDVGHTIPFPGTDINVWASISQLVVLFDKPLPLGCKPAIDLLVPVVSTDIDFSRPGRFPEDNGTGFGDITIGPALQFDAIKDECDRTIFSHRLEAQFILPTGKYSSSKDINPGSGFFSFDPYWSGTLFVTPKCEVSYRAHYLWNASFDEPANRFHAHSARAGEAFHINFATSYEVIEKKLRVGFNGYWLTQTTDTELDGVKAPGREQVVAFGPGVLYRLGKQTHVIFNYYFEADAINRPEGNRLNLQFAHKF
jgi:hypothetical protein